MPENYAAFEMLENCSIIGKMCLKKGGSTVNYEGKVVLVTGAANGIGLEIAKTYKGMGAAVVAADIDESSAEGLKDFGLDFYWVDIKKPMEIEKLFEYTVETYGKVDILINNAGISRFKPLEDLGVEEWDEVMAINLRAPFLCAKEFVKYNRGSSYGRVVNISSTRYLMSEPGGEAYGASKGGIVSLTHAQAVSLSGENITVNCISPGWIQNRNYDSLSEADHAQHPSKRVGKPADIARACVFLTGEENDFINGENIVVDGGMTKKMIYED